MLVLSGHTVSPGSFSKAELISFLTSDAWHGQQTQRIRRTRWKRSADEEGGGKG